MPVTYGWRPGSRVALDAQKAGRELAKIERTDGALTPEGVLERARDDKSALHAHFEWDDAAAAEAHRLGQAGELIRSITVDITRSNIEPAKTVRAFVNVKEGPDRHYVSTQRALTDRELRAQVIAKAWADLEAWRQRHAELVEFARVFAVIDEARVAAA